MRLDTNRKNYITASNVGRTFATEVSNSEFEVRVSHTPILPFGR